MKKIDYFKKGIIFNIQKFSVHDGPGIRTVVFFKGCPLRCRWCSNPESQFTGMQILWNEKKCIHCNHCVDMCPTNAISNQNNRIYIDNKKCDGCLKCVEECSGRALKAEGETKTVQEVMDVVIQDKAFYDESNGGITLSGGEFLAQSDFAIELLLASKAEKINTCCETSGYAPPKVFAKVIKHLDYILFDVKHWSSSKHKLGTGVSNKLPIINLKYAIKIKENVLPRIPVIPHFNANLNDAYEFTKLFKKIGAKKCQLLPFHQFGENKYNLLNQKYDYKNIEALHKEELEKYIKVFHDNDIEAFF